MITILFVCLCMIAGGFAAVFFAVVADITIGLLDLGIVITLTGIVDAFSAVASLEAKSRETFMAACLADREKNECDAMWCAGATRATLPPFILPQGRQ